MFRAEKHACKSRRDLSRSKCATDNFPVCPDPWFVSTDLTKGFYLVPCNSYIAVLNCGIIFCFCEIWHLPLLFSSSSLARVCCHWGAGLQSKQACFFPTGLPLTGQRASATIWHFADVPTNIQVMINWSSYIRTGFCHLYSLEAAPVCNHLLKAIRKDTAHC